MGRTRKLFPLKVGWGISRMNEDSQQNSVHRNFVVETALFVGSSVNVILTQQTCSQHSSRAAESKHLALEHYFPERIWYMFSIPKCRRDWDVGHCTFWVLAKREPLRKDNFRNKHVSPAGKIGIWHCVLVLFSHVTKKCTNLDLSKETKQTEELEEAGYRSLTSAVLWALQQINSATRIEGEAAISAPPFFQSAGRGELLFWGWKEGPILVIWESLSEHEKKTLKLAGRVDHDARLGRVVQVKKRGGGNLLIWAQWERNFPWVCAFRILCQGSWYVIPCQGFLELKSPAWIPVRAQQNGHATGQRAAATDHL